MASNKLRARLRQLERFMAHADVVVRVVGLGRDRPDVEQVLEAHPHAVSMVDPAAGSRIGRLVGALAFRWASRWYVPRWVAAVINAGGAMPNRDLGGLLRALMRPGARPQRQAVVVLWTMLCVPDGLPRVIDDELRELAAQARGAP